MGKLHVDIIKLISIAAVVAAFILLDTDASTYIVSPDYNKNIQDVISDTHDGDRIIVKSGEYDAANIEINKKIYLIGIDTGGGMPVLDANNMSSALTILADGVLVQGFVVKNSGRGPKNAGLRAVSRNCTIKANRFHNNEYGIVFEGSANNRIVDNVAFENEIGIALYTTENCDIEKNTVFDNSFCGLLLGKSNNNTLDGNNASSNSGMGIILSEGRGNRINNNRADLNEDAGIWVFSSNDNVLEKNEVARNCIFGIHVYHSNGNKVKSNVLSKNFDGICLEHSSYNVIAENHHLQNTYGIYVDNSLWNSIFLNDFVDNTVNAYSWNSSNCWNTSDKIYYVYKGAPYRRHLGNFWSDHGGPDPYGDGIVDDPRPVSDVETDHAPLRRAYSMYRLTG